MKLLCKTFKKQAFFQKHNLKKMNITLPRKGIANIEMLVVIMLIVEHCDKAININYSHPS